MYEYYLSAFKSSSNIPRKIIFIASLVAITELTKQPRGLLDYHYIHDEPKRGATKVKHSSQGGPNLFTK